MLRRWLHSPERVVASVQARGGDTLSCSRFFCGRFGCAKEDKNVGGIRSFDFVLCACCAQDDKRKKARAVAEHNNSLISSSPLPLPFCFQWLRLWKTCKIFCAKVLRGKILQTHDLGTIRCALSDIAGGHCVD